jgi:O-antigen/teichoic acid export membrane protein
MATPSRGALWATAGNWIQQGFSLFTMLVVARVLDPASFGLLATALLFVLLLQRVLMESIGYAVVQRKEVDDTYLSTAFWLACLGGVLLGGLLFAARHPLARFFEEPNLAPVIGALALIPAVDGVATVHTALFKREMRFKVLAMRTLGVNLVGATSGLVLAFAGAGVWALVTQQLVQTIGSFAVLWRSHHWRPQRTADRAASVELLRFGGPMVLNALMFVLSNRLDVMALATYAGASATGIYSIAKRLARAVTDLLVSGIATAALTTLSARADDDDARNAFFAKQLHFLAWLSFPAFVSLAVVAPDLVPGLLGARWETAAPALRYLCVFGVLQVPVLFGSNLLIAAEQTRLLLVLNAASLAVLAAMLFSGVMPIGPAEVAAMFAVQATFTLALLAGMLRQRARTPLAVLFGPLAWPLALAMASGAAVLALALAPAVRPYLSGLSGSVLQLGAYAAVYLLLTSAFDRQNLQLLLQKVRRRPSA